MEIERRPSWMTPMAYSDGSGAGPAPVEPDPEPIEDFYARGPKDEITGDIDEEEGADDFRDE